MEEATDAGADARADAVADPDAYDQQADVAHTHARLLLSRQHSKPASYMSSRRHPLQTAQQRLRFWLQRRMLASPIARLVIPSLAIIIAYW